MRLKNILILASLLIFTFFLQSCQIDDLNGGNDDQNDDISKFIGTWNVSDQSSRINYKVTIERDPVYADQVYLQNFADAGGKASGLVAGNNIVIDKQEIGGGYSAEGDGSYIKTDQLNFEFVLDDGIDLYSRKANFTK